MHAVTNQHDIWRIAQRFAFHLLLFQTKKTYTSGIYVKIHSCYKGALMLVGKKQSKKFTTRTNEEGPGGGVTPEKLRNFAYFFSMLGM